MHPETKTLETERLYLKEVTPELFEHIFEHHDDEYIKAYFDLDDAGLAQSKERLKKGMTNYYMTFKYFLLRDKINNKTIGTCGYYRWMQDHNRAEIGYVMSDTSYREKGLMKEAILPIFHFGFEEMGVHRLEALASPENTPSVKILEGLGLKCEGVLREHYLRDGVYEPSASYSILKHEYEEKYKS